MAKVAKPKISIDVLLMVFDSPKPYIQLPKDFRADGVSEEKIKSTLDQTRDSLEAKRKDIIYGVSWKTSRAGEVGVLWIELTEPTTETLRDAQAWLDEIGLAWAQANEGWKKNPNDDNQGYTGYSLQKK